MELAHSLLLNEDALKRISESKRPVFIFEWLRFLDKVLIAAQKVCYDVIINMHIYYSRYQPLEIYPMFIVFLFEFLILVVERETTGKHCDITRCTKIRMLLSNIFTLQSDIKESQTKLISQLTKQISENPGHPTRKLLARCLATIFSVGDTFALFETINKCNDVIKNKDDSPSYLPTKL